VFGIIFLIIVETDIFACIGKLTIRSITARKEDLELDEDVLAEEERVRNQV
jgi:hypothetical protein